MSDPPANAQVAFRIMEEAFGAGNFSVLDQVIAGSFIEHQPGMPSDSENLKRVITHLRTAFPDMLYTCMQWSVDGDKVWVHYRATGTHKGIFQNIQPTGRTFEIDVFDVMRFENGKLVEHWGVPDRFALLLAIGAWPPSSA